MKNLIQFVKESFAELKKVSWPTQEDVKESTVVVLITVVVMALFLGLVDKLISIIIKMVLK